MNENRTVFAFGGVTGALVAILALVATLITLTTIGLFIQKDNAQNYYTIEKVETLKTINEGKTSDDFVVSVPAPK